MREMFNFEPFGYDDFNPDPEAFELDDGGLTLDELRSLGIEVTTSNDQQDIELVVFVGLHPVATRNLITMLECGEIGSDTAGAGIIPALQKLKTAIERIIAARTTADAA